MIISLIAAMSENSVIGINNTLPWHLPLDLQHFKKLTLGKPLIMGRKTHQSIGKALPGRDNIILTQDTLFSSPGCKIAHSINEAYQLAEPAKEVFVIGGQALYEQTLPDAHYLYLTLIHAQIAGNIHFPKWQANEWFEIQRETFPADERHRYAFSFIILERRK